MKYLILFSFLLAGCSSPLSTKIEDGKIITDKNLRYFSDQCEKLAKCVGGTGEIVHFQDQSHNPYACSINKTGKTRKKSLYFYPKAEIYFGEIQFDGFLNAISACEMTNETGEQSDSEYARRDETLKAINRQKAERLKREAEQLKERQRLAEQVKIREVK